MNKHNLTVHGKWFIENYDKTGKLVQRFEVFNNITDEGLDKILDVMFGVDTKVAAWYAGLIDNVGFVAFADGDLLNSHAGWDEFATYTGNRKQWSPGASSSQEITNAVSMDFAITGDGVVHGGFICSAASGTTGVLWSTAAFAANLTVTNGSTIKLVYTLTAAYV